MDPLESLNIKDDTTLAIIEECLLRKFKVWHFLPKDVSYINGCVVAASKKIDFSFKFPGKEIKTKSECIPKDASKGNENLET